MWKNPLIYRGDISETFPKAMKRLGLNPSDQEMVDIPNRIAKNGLIYFPDFCQIVLKRWREENEVVFRQGMFKVRALTKVEG